MSEKGFRDETNTGESGPENVPAKARLCYVDDSRTSAYVIRRLLKPFGYHVEHFASAEPAFVALVQENYDLLLTDLKVSPTGMDGDDLIRTLRQSGHPQLSNLPIIVITGATDAEALVGVYDAGANQVMKKPVDADELDQHIQRLLATVQRVEPAAAEAEPQKPSRRTSDNTVVTLHTALRPPRESESSVSNQLSQKSAFSTAKTEAPALNEATPAVEPLDPVITAEPAPLDPHILPAADAVGDSSILRAMEAKQAVADNPVPAETDLPDEVIFENPYSADSSEEVVIIEPETHDGGNGHYGTGSADHNILSEIEQYPLVSEQRRGIFSQFSVSSLLRSTGLRNLLIRTLIAGLVLLALLAGWDIYFNKGRPALSR